MLYESIPSNGYVMQLLRPEIPQFLIPISIFSSISCVNLYTNVCTLYIYLHGQIYIYYIDVHKYNMSIQTSIVYIYSACFNINMKNGDKNNNNKSPNIAKIVSILYTSTLYDGDVYIPTIYVHENVRNIASENLRVILYECVRCYDKEIPHLIP